ncbi:MAG TPA: thiol-disulfide isomerase [Blastocatellia bacterium]|nr:thiol-disulfide isomerase [Blastocatellia bacterium]
MKRILGFGIFAGLLAGSLVISSFGSHADGGAKTPSEVTFTRDVAPIIQKNCQVCHRPGEIAPMSLLDYKQVRPWARSIREKVLTREMPPWFADPSHGEFSNDCRLSQNEIDLVSAWVDGGAKEGDPKDMPPNPTFTEGWQIGKPDVTLSMTEDFNIPAQGVIPYKYFAVPTNFTEDKYVQLAEIRQGDRAHVHHVIVSVEYPDKDGHVLPAGEVKVSSLGALRQSIGEESDGRVCGWAPGEAPLILKPGQAKLIKKGSVLIFQVHYTTNGEVGKDRSSVGFIFSKTPVEKRVITAGAAAHKLVIPPGDPNYESTASFTFKEDSHIESLHPHMHWRGKDFVYTLVYPDGSSKVLLAVPHFNFGWQLTYFLKQPVAAPAGSKLEVLAHHDNSASNKFNPDPTKEVHWGDQTWDEMMIGFFDYTVDKQDLRKGHEDVARAGQ